MSDNVYSEQHTVTIWLIDCPLCDLKYPDDPVERAWKTWRSEETARRGLARHRAETHVAPWFPDRPKCEGCGKSGPIPSEAYVIHFRGSDMVSPVEEKPGEMQRLERDASVPYALPDQWWHASCRSRYHSDPAIEDEIDERYEQRIKDEQQWTEEVRALIDQTEEEGILWGPAWKRDFR